MSEFQSYRLSVAPMMDWTDRHCRVFHRLLSQRTLLYSEMVPAGAIVHGDRDRFLTFDPSEHPVALQVGGSDPDDLETCARAAADYGYDEINLNVGCPSDRVQRGRFGACLMAEPDLVARCVEAMRRAPIEVTVKTRIGIDAQDSYEELHDFVGKLAAVGTTTVIIHARKAWLSGLSPKQNREIPPLRYDVVHRLKGDYPDLAIVLNGGVQDLAQSLGHLERVDGVMIGRAAYHDPYLLAEADQRIFRDVRPVATRPEIVMNLMPYAEKLASGGVPVKHLTRHILGLFNGERGARLWRRYLSENAHLPGAGPQVILEALEQVRAAQDGRAAA
ncbi:tRNA dihydrouridine(20/20a) synthase DusA [Denitrobaculum tricleocarpae]|uniref:tRNA-dihydrouridine(20/20a) synthase n=1 Tax=Denitrobaculum tricleocarpae TaxID=2591009 RepID=A0A545U2E5_9PROT|nr:tRNA dihydrouridine(20/20a) synthase DusA [Denitrobaculum tricleocarpae]TQV83604.1 tRNA dihydrouridine(20/20a) synthase DusA [Denitrobaculum tricleocarpae]